jgi:hypothetical protein
MPGAPADEITALISLQVERAARGERFGGQKIYLSRALTPPGVEIRIRGSFSRRGTQAANGSRL